MDVRIETRYAVFGLVVEDKTVIRAASIARWTLGESIDTVVKHYMKQRAKLTYTLHTGKEPQL